MAISLKKIEQEAPQLIDLAKKADTADCRFMKYSNSTWKISIR
jgi:hypothetical protein